MIAVQEKLAESPDDPETLLNFHAHIKPIRAELAYLEEAGLIVRAEQCGIELSPDLYSNFDSFPRVLTAHGRAFLYREINRLRRESIKEWASILVPILSLLVALAAVLKK